jgi:hypothetical protein
MMGLFMMFVPLSLLAKDNLAKYSVYYAGNLPHKNGTDPELVAIIDNLDKIYIPNLDKSSRVDNFLGGDNYIYSNGKKYQYFYDAKQINYKDSFNELQIEKNWYSKETNKIYYLYFMLGKDYITEFFDSTGKITLFEKNDDLYKVTKVDLKKFKESKDILIGNIIKAKQKPVINLQFIYNYLNQSKFN